MKTQTTTEKLTLAIDQMPAVPSGGSFHLREVKKISIPHLYCLTPNHIAEAANHWGGMLGADAIRAAEKSGACCDICRHSGQGILKFDQHESQMTLFIVIPPGIRDLNQVEGLHAYLSNNKATFENFGIQGFAFPSS